MEDELDLFPIGQIQEEISYKDESFYLRSTVLLINLKAIHQERIFPRDWVLALI